MSGCIKVLKLGIMSVGRYT